MSIIIQYAVGNPNLFEPQNLKSGYRRLIQNSVEFKIQILQILYFNKF